MQAEGRNVLYPFVSYSREEWTRLPVDDAFSLSDEEVRGIEPRLSPEEARSVYLPVSRLLYLHYSAVRGLYRAARGFLVGEEREVPFVVGVAGSVAAGKSTVAGVLRALISRWPGSPTVGLVSTDGFIFPNSVLQERGLMERKGFPESYDLPLLLGFLAAVKSGDPETSVPIHSHLTYDILPDERQPVGQPDVLVVEGLNMLEAGLPEPEGGHMVFVSDYVDFSIYVDARESYIKKWYLERFLRLRRGGARRRHRLLPPLHGAPRRGGHRPRHARVGRDRPPQPKTEHRAHQRPRPPDPRKREGPLRSAHTPEEDLSSAPGRGRIGFRHRYQASGK